MGEAFLTPAWFSAAAERFANGTPPPDSEPLVVRFEFADAPAGGPSAVTIIADGGAWSVTPDGDVAADVVVRLTYDDGAALFSGRLTSSRALRDGRFKVSGDVSRLPPFWGRTGGTVGEPD